MRINDYPDVVSVKGSIVSTDNTNALDQDLFEVELKNGVFIDVGWYPEHDVNGEFFIRAFLENWENQLLTEPFTTKHQDEADYRVKELISHFSGHLISQSLSNKSDFTIDNPVLLEV